MSWIFVGLIALIIVIVALSQIAKQPDNLKLAKDKFEYQQVKALFTPAERSFYGVLKLAINDEVEAFGKVRVADVITPKGGQNRSDWQTAFNKISSKHFDFLICRTTDLSPLCAIELNDKSHNSKKTKERDEFLERACKSANIPLVQIPAKATYKISDIRQHLSAHLPEQLPSESESDPDIGENEAKSNFTVCPKCSSSITIRTAKSGNTKGKKYLTCSTFPACKYILPIDK